MMRWILELQGETVEIRAERTGSGSVVVSYEGKQQQLDASSVGAVGISLVDSSHQGTLVRVEPAVRAGSAGQIWLRGRAVPAAVSTPNAYALRVARAREQEDAASVTLLAPMGGKVVAVICAEGDAVAKGAGLVVIEAMKMENEVRAPVSGLVSGLTVRVGDIVDAQAPLCAVVRETKD